MSELDVGSAVIGDHVEFDGLAEAHAFLIDDGREAQAGAVVADGDGGVAHVAGGLVAGGVVAESVVGAHFAGAFEQEEFAAKRAGGEVTDAAEVQTESVDGFHAEGGMFAGVIGVFDPAGKFVVELPDAVEMAEVAHEELVAHGAEEAFDLAFGGTVSNGSVDQHGAEAGADDAELFGGIVRTVVHIDRLGHSALVERGLEAVDEVGGVVGLIERAVRNDARSVVNEADEVGLDGLFESVGEVGTVQGVALPEIVGMGFGKGQARFGAGVVGGFEQIETVDVPAKSVRRDLGAPEQSLFNATPVNLGDVILFAVEGGQHLLDGFQQMLGRDLAGGALIGPCGGFGNAVLAVEIPPGLDGSPGEPARLAILVGEGHCADRLITGEVGLAECIFEGTEHPHSQIIAYAFHVAGEPAAAHPRVRHSISCCGEKMPDGQKRLRCQSGHPAFTVRPGDVSVAGEKAPDSSNPHPVIGTCSCCWNAAMGQATAGKVAIRWRSVNGSVCLSAFPGGGKMRQSRVRTWAVQSFHLAIHLYADRADMHNLEGAQAP